MGVFPNGLFSWLNRVDNVNVDYAEDPNALAGEIIAIETDLGVNPQVEKNIPTGGTSTYATVDARISDTLNRGQIPVCELRGTNQNCPSGKPIFNTHSVAYDPFSMFNGQDITIPCNGWWIVTSSNNWSSPRVNTGFSLCTLYMNGGPMHVHCWRWDFPNPIYLPNCFPGYFSDDYRYNTSPALPSADTGWNFTTWQGLAHAGDRFQVQSFNGTTTNPHALNSYTLKASFVRSVTGTFTSG
jgi:hypothetical protein